MITAPIRALQAHPAQMRTTYDVEAMTQLTLQIHTSGVHDWQAIVAAPNGDGYHIVSGHRRTMAVLFAWALTDWLARPEQEREAGTPPTSKETRAMLGELVERHGDVAAAAQALLTHYGAREIRFAPFDGDEKAQILALQSANFGGEVPDMLGIARSFRAALEAGATVEEVARNGGHHANTVRNHVALTALPADLARAIAAGALPLGVAPAVEAVPRPRRDGLVSFLLANVDGSRCRLTGGEVQQLARALSAWSGPQVPLLAAHQTQRNLARATVNLWAQVVAAYPAETWAAAALLVYEGQHEEPWQDPQKLSRWFQILGGDVYHDGQDIRWENVVAHLLPEVGCAHCPIARLPPQTLRQDLAAGGGPLGMPCRFGEEAERCLHGFGAGDSCDVRVPDSWSGLPGVVHDGGRYRVRDPEQLLAAWQARAAQEAEEDEAVVVMDDVSVTSTAGVPEEAAAPAPASTPEAAAQPEAAPPRQETPSPVAKMRARVADFMDRHTRLAVRHSFATPCDRCRHQLGQSPTKDPDVPHCAWADRLRNVSFRVLTPTAGPGPAIPVCGQFAPAGRWTDLIPPHPEPGARPRAWLKEQILALAAAVGNRFSGRQVFEFLTGRPMRADEKYNDWFRVQLAEQIGELSDAQLVTLFLWVHSEWRRGADPFPLPVDATGAQFAPYREQRWAAYWAARAEEKDP